jgi:probable biosynthetic protein (TIGR04098 family)
VVDIHDAAQDLGSEEALGFIRLVQKVAPLAHIEDLGLAFREAGLDSLDLVSIRAELENRFDYSIPEARWMNFSSLAEVIRFCMETSGVDSEAATGATSLGNSEDIFREDNTNRTFSIGMPQMATGSLSENWLFKELGDMHWNMLCRGLNVDSSRLTDALGNRLYPTFVRIRLNMPSSLFAFTENSVAELTGDMSRFGRGIYYSQLRFATPRASIDANLMTSFAVRGDSSNSNLVKSCPDLLDNHVHGLALNPLFGEEYRRFKKDPPDYVDLAGVKLSVTDNVLFETVYRLNPYVDVNGANLLYFAAFPTINDYCESVYLNETAWCHDLPWEQQSATIARDIFYFANCDIHERVIYRLHGCDTLPDGCFKLSSSLTRQSDGVIMARIFTVKNTNSER